MLFGEHAVVFGSPCIVTAVNQRLSMSVTQTMQKTLVISAPDVGLSEYTIQISELSTGSIPRSARFVCRAVSNFYSRYNLAEGLTINTTSEFTSTMGFGSSSAVVVCTIKALSTMFEIPLSMKDIFDISYQTVIDVQGTGSGFDIASALFGGTLYFVKGGATLEPLQIPSLPLIIGYTGIKADTTTLVNQVAVQKQKEPDKIQKIMTQISNIVENGKIALVQQDFAQIGALFNENQTLLEQLGVSSPELDTLITAARNAGAYGAKLSGAGGGDCMIAVSSEDRYDAVCQEITKAGGTIIQVETQARGVTIE